MSSSEPKLASDYFHEFFFASVPMWIYVPSSLAIVEVNEAALKRYGYSRAEFLNMTILDIRPVNDVMKLVRIALRPHPTSGLIWRHQKKNGMVISVKVISEDVDFQGHRARMVRAEEAIAKVEAPADAGSGTGHSPSSR